MSHPPSLHAHVATVYFKAGGTRDIHYDVIQCVTNGFNFIREGGCFDYLSASLVAEISSRPNDMADVMGRA